MAADHRYAVHDFARKLRQPALFPRVLDYVAWQRAVRAARAKGEAPPPMPDVGPLSVNLDQTTACNYACEHCIDWEILNSGISHEDRKLRASIEDMARRGLVVDLHHEGRRFVSLAPVVIGFFEFTFMRTRDDLPMKRLAELFEQYFYEDDRFGRAVFQGETQIGRSLVREEALPADDHVEILDWERASRIVESAGAHAVSLCACRHKAAHLDHACDRPLETCLTLNEPVWMVYLRDRSEEVACRGGRGEQRRSVNRRNVMLPHSHNKAAGLR